MKRLILRVIGSMFLLGYIIGANAASVTLLPNTPTTDLPAGTIVSFDIMMDFSDVDGTLGGGFDLTFDESHVGLQSFTSAFLGDPGFGRDPDYVPGSGLLESWGVGDFNGIQNGLIGSVEFQVLGAPGASFISLGPTSGIAGPWVSAVDFTTIIDPDYNMIEVTSVPLPAAGWLFVSALLGLAGFKRRFS